MLSVEIVKDLINRYRLYRDKLLFADIEKDEMTEAGM